VSEWLVMNKYICIQCIYVLEWINGYCVTLSDIDDAFFVLDQHAELDVHSASSLQNSTRVNMSSHLKTLLVDVLICAHTQLNPFEYVQLSG